MAVESFSKHQAVYKKDCTLWTPKECLLDLIEYIDKENPDITRLLVSYLVRDKDDRLSYRFQACKMTYDEHISLLRIAEKDALEDWCS